MSWSARAIVRWSAERLAVTHTRTPMEWAPGEGGAESTMHGAKEALAFWELVGLTLDGRRAHPRHTW